MFELRCRDSRTTRLSFSICPRARLRNSEASYPEARRHWPEASNASHSVVRSANTPFDSTSTTADPLSTFSGPWSSISPSRLLASPFRNLIDEIMAFNLASPARPSSQRPPNGYHYQRSPSSSSPAAGPPVFPSGIPVSRSHVGNLSNIGGSSSPAKARPQSAAVSRGTPSRSGHAASKSLDVSSRSPAPYSTPPAAPINMADVERDFQNMMVSPIPLRRRRVSSRARSQQARD